MNTHDDVNDFLLSGGVPSAKFPTIGTTVKGTVVSSTVAQQTDYTSGKPKFYDDGNPMMQVVVTLQTAERDPAVENDDGLRKVYVRGQMTKAVSDALRTAGAKLANGGTLAVQYTGDKPAEKAGLNPAKQYRAQYQPPTGGNDAANDLLGGSTAPEPTAAPVTADSLI